MTNPAWFIVAVGCALIGFWASSWELGLGMYFCIAGHGNWNAQ